MSEKLLNYVNGAWRESAAERYLEVPNPATAEVLATVPLSPPSDVDEAALAAAEAFKTWRRVPAPTRIQYLFKLKALLEEHFEELSRSIVMENGKTLDDARGEMRRAVENVEVACGIPSLMLGDFSEDVARGIDEYMIRQPVGVAALICPFNFPGMIPFWYLPYALACGNAVIVKPSERCPITMQKVFRLLDQVGFPKGVVSLVNGGADTVNALLDHPAISRGHLRWLDAGRAAHLRPCLGQRQARAGPGWRQEPDHHLARCGRRTDDQHRFRQRLWQRGSALPGRIAGGYRRRGGQDLRAGVGRGGCQARGGLRARCGRAVGAGDHPTKQDAHRDVDPKGSG